MTGLKQTTLLALALLLTLTGTASALKLPLTNAGTKANPDPFPIPISLSAKCPLPWAGSGDGSPQNPGVGACAAVPPPYPDYGTYNSREDLAAAAQKLSDDLKAFVAQWFADGAPSGRKIPANLLPSGMEAKIGDFTLIRPEDVDPAKQWLVRPAHEVDPKGEMGFYPDPQVTYLVQPTFYAPFGTEVEMTGQFPRARFFDVQPSPPFDPDVYYYGGSTGAGASEVPIVDADIQPDAGSSNPFLPGADRTVTKRDYTVKIKMAAGDAIALNPAFKPPFRGVKDNTVVGSGIEYVGPGGCDKAYQPLSKGRGCFSAGNIWVRYYLPDAGPDGKLDPKGGVPLPKLVYKLNIGGVERRFYIQADIAELTAWANTKAAYKEPGIVGPNDPRGDTEGPTVGWFPEYGVLRTIAESLSRAIFSPQSPGIEAGNSYARAYDAGFNSHGQPGTENIKPGTINSYAHGATEAVYVQYLTRTMNRKAGNVVVLTGTMPTTPRTVQGDARFVSAQARYWSITNYPSLFTYPGVQPETSGQPASTDNWPGVSVASVYDEQVALDSRRRYTIVYSSPEDRPANANAANGVTWVNWGKFGGESLTMRWLTVDPDWASCRSFDESRIGWKGDMSSTDYDKSLFANNTNVGYLGDYQPVVHYMTKGGFEALGNRTAADQIPAWTGNGSSSPTDTGPGVPTGRTDCQPSGVANGDVSIGPVKYSGGRVRATDPNGYNGGYVDAGPGSATVCSKDPNGGEASLQGEVGSNGPNGGYGAKCPS